MGTMGFVVTKSTPSLVTPRDDTPKVTLPLSSIDRHPSHWVWIDTYHVFKKGAEPVKTIRDALSRALVPYYPLAGRFSKSIEGELEVACTGVGVCFVEAKAECSLEDVNYLERPLLLPRDDIVPSPADPVKDHEEMLVMMQVTEFTCGGFVVGFRSNHAIADGLAIAQFLQAIGDFARGLTEPTIPPVWLRDSLPGPAHLSSDETGPPPNRPTTPLHHLTVDITPVQIDHLKTQFKNQTGRWCSTVDALFAKVWQSRTKAIGLDNDVKALLHFFADARPMLRHVLPPSGGYYGNCIYPVKVVVTGGEVARAEIVEVVEMIKEAKEKMRGEFSLWAKGKLEEDPNKIEFNYESFFVADWSRVGFNEVDYGWGRPVYAGPLLTDDHTIPMCILVKPPAPKLGARLMTWCVESGHLEAFRDLMMSWD